MLLCLGPEGTGKTLLLRRILPTEKNLNLRTVPTIGVNIHTLCLANNSEVTIRELGGCMAPIWKNYFSGVQRIIYVVDAANLMQIGAATLLFLELLSNSLLQQAEPACVLGSPHRDCFITIPQKWAKLLKPSPLPTFSIESETQTVVLSWAGEFHDHGEDIVCANNYLLSLNGIKSSTLVTVKQIETPTVVSSVSVNITSQKEWDIFVLNEEFVQLHFLNQIRILTGKQKFPLWLEGGNCVTLEVEASFQQSLVYVDTNLHVCPPISCDADSMTINPNRQIEGNSKTYDLKKAMSSVLNYDSTGRMKNYLAPFINTNAQKFTDQLYLRTSLITVSGKFTRVSVLEKLAKHPTLLVISKDVVKNTMHEHQLYIVVTVTKYSMVETEEDKKTTVLNTQNTQLKTLTCIALVLENFLKKNSCNDSKIWLQDCVHGHCCAMSNSLAKTLKLDSPSIVKVEIQKNNVSMERTIVHVHGYTAADKKDKESVVSKLSSTLKAICDIVPIILNKYSVLSLLGDSSERILIIFVKGTHVLLNSTTVGLVTYNLVYGDTIVSSTPKTVSGPCQHRALANEIFEHIAFDWTHIETPSQFVLLQGSKGSGKTTLTQYLSCLSTRKPCPIYTETLDLKRLCGKKVRNIHKEFVEMVNRAMFYQPSLLILDDLDCLVPHDPTDVDHDNPSHQYAKRVADMIKIEFEQLRMSKCLVTILATCRNRQYIHPIVALPQGKHIFSKAFSITQVDNDVRLNVVLECLQYFRSSSHEKFDKDLWACIADPISWKKICATQLQRFSLADLNNLSLRIFMSANSRWNLEKKLWTADASKMYGSQLYCVDDLKSALENFTPTALKDLKQDKYQQSNLVVGGLHSAKKMVFQTILWPIKYPKLFSQSSMRPRCGILLYGPPGCGKTLLARSISSSKLCNFICIKGPELLSKYIGKSEESIRKAFEQAANMKPCVLFFDEFDALAPRRGHDNTGVTDRVVNQFLTEMDGVNGLTGVSVLAATSRPDLIDPALLRPGRLDKCIYCPMPSKLERAEILKVLGTNLSFQGDIDWDEIADGTPYYSGADLQSLLATAQVKAAQELLGDSLYQTLGKSHEKDIGSISSNGITMCHIRDAMKSSKPSISDSERLKYEKLQESFIAGRKSGFGKVEPGQKGTFA